MPAPLVVQLFGPPRFVADGEPVSCPSRKSVALYAYLALTGRPQSRQSLAALFWGRRDDDAARNSLRAALHRLPAALATTLRADRDRVAIDEAVAATTDVARFWTLAQSGELDSLENATGLYADELLKDFDAQATAEFDDWLHAERARLRQAAQGVFERVVAARNDRARVDAARATTERERALGTALRWTELMPASEAGHRWLMRLYLDMGRREAALAQYELCQRQLAIASGRSPSPETMQLRDLALAGTPPAARDEQVRERTASTATPVAGLVAATSFVGRVDELAELDRLLGEPACRLVTLHGLGGAGKTRLAHALASQVAVRFEHGIAWAPLEGHASADALPGAIADALGRTLPPGGDRVAALVRMLETQQRLLVLDNFETMLHATGDAASIVATIVQSAPGVRMLVTSREVLGLQEEWIYDVRGLACPEDSAKATAPHASPAVQLFAERARQSYLGFSLQAELPHVVRICRLVEGLPLAIELAAAWVRTVPCADLAAAIVAEATPLSTRHRNRPDRHRSLEAVVACSWNLLNDEQRDALAAIGIFASGFTREAAESVAGISLRMLSALADKALLRRTPNGRYEVHEIVRRFASARLRQSRREASTAKRHAAHYGALLLERSAQLKGPSEPEADAALRSDLPNLMAAWQRSAGAPDVAFVERHAPALISLLHTRGRLPEAIAVGERAMSLLADHGRDDALAAVRVQYGRAAVSGSAPQRAREALELAVAHARASGNAEMLARCVYYLATVDYQQGRIDSGVKLADEALALGARSEDDELRMLVHNVRGVFAIMQTQFALAEALLKTALEAARRTGAPSAMAGLLCGLGVPLYYQGRYAEAAAVNEEAGHLYETLGRHATAATVWCNLSGIRLALGDLQGTRRAGENAARLARECGGMDDDLAISLNNIADALMREGDRDAARARLGESLEASRRSGGVLSLTETLYLFARLELSAGDRDAALAHIGKLRDRLASNRFEIRVPMLIVAAAEWALDDASRRTDALQWLAAVSNAENADATLRDTARKLVEANGGASLQAPACLADAERDVLAFLASLPTTRR